MPEQLNIYQKLAKIRKPVEILQKNKKGYGYKYVTEDIILSKITGLMNKYGVSLIPGIKENTISVEPYSYEKTKSTQSGEIYNEKVNEVIVKGDMEWSWINNDNPEERVRVPWALVGQQADASQAFGSGLTYSSRYFLLKYFNVATSEDDPDKWRSDQKAAENMENIEIAQGIVEQVHTIVGAYLEKYPDKRQDVTDTVKKYAKEKGKPSANYFAIEDPTVANKLFAEVSEKYTIKEDKE